MTTTNLPLPVSNGADKERGADNHPLYGSAPLNRDLVFLQQSSSQGLTKPWIILFHLSPALVSQTTDHVR